MGHVSGIPSGSSCSQCPSLYGTFRSKIDEKKPETGGRVEKSEDGPLISARFRLFEALLGEPESSMLFYPNEDGIKSALIDHISTVRDKTETLKIQLLVGRIFDGDLYDDISMIADDGIQNCFEECFSSRETLAPEIGLLTKLKKLDLSCNGLTSLPKEIGDLELLEELDLQKNRIKAFPVEFQNLENLKHLNLSDNRIARLPVEALAPNLEELHLNNNPLSSLPKEISNLSKLQKIHVTPGQIRPLPQGFKEETPGLLTKLEEREIEKVESGSSSNSCVWITAVAFSIFVGAFTTWAISVEGDDWD